MLYSRAVGRPEAVCAPHGANKASPLLPPPVEVGGFLGRPPDAVSLVETTGAKQFRYMYMLVDRQEISSCSRITVVVQGYTIGRYISICGAGILSIRWKVLDECHEVQVEF